MKIENITLRDWFAAQALNGLMYNEVERSRYEILQVIDDDVSKAYDKNGEIILAVPAVTDLYDYSEAYIPVATAAYALANAMMLARDIKLSHEFQEPEV